MDSTNVGENGTFRSLKSLGERITSTPEADKPANQLSAQRFNQTPTQGNTESPTSAGTVTETVLQPIPPVQPRRRIDLTKAVLPDVGQIEAVQSLVVRELKGVGNQFTPNLAAIVNFYGLAYKPRGAFETEYQIMAGALKDDPRVMKYARRIAFVPAFNWSTFEIVLMPIKMNTYGGRVLDDLKTLEPRFPGFKTFIEWSDQKHRHVVNHDVLTQQEAGVIAAIEWPEQGEILNALSATAFDNLTDLIAANEEIRVLIHSVEVR